MEDTEKSDGAPALSLVQSRSRESRRNTSCACCSLRDVETGPPDPQRLGCKSRRMSPRRSRTQIPLPRHRRHMRTLHCCSFLGIQSRDCPDELQLFSNAKCLVAQRIVSVLELHVMMRSKERLTWSNPFSVANSRSHCSQRW